MAAGRQNMIRADLLKDVSDQRAALGLLYAELAADVAKTDKQRAKRLLSTAARVDPANTSVYQNQLKSFDSSATLPQAKTQEVAPQPPAPTPLPAQGSGAPAAGSGGVQ